MLCFLIFSVNSLRPKKILPTNGRTIIYGRCHQKDFVAAGEVVNYVQFVLKALSFSQSLISNAVEDFKANAPYLLEFSSNYGAMNVVNNLINYERYFLKGQFIGKTIKLTFCPLKFSGIKGELSAKKAVIIQILNEMKQYFPEEGRDLGSHLLKHL